MPSSLSRFRKFQEQQAGILPPALAASYLEVTRQRLDQLARAKKLQFQTVARTRYYGLRSLRTYKENRTVRRSLDTWFPEKSAKP